jgi:hypothetical protein
MAFLTCLIFTAQEWNGDGFDPTRVWAQHLESNRNWFFRVPLTNRSEEDILNLPRSVMLHFEPLPGAHFRTEDVFAYRMGTAHMNEEDLDRDWVAAPALSVVFRDPKDECDWDGVS